MPKKDERTTEADAIDLLYGFLSIIDQFGGVLRERGRDYRKSQEGRRLEVDLNDVYESFGDREKGVLNVVLSSLDGMIKTVRELDQKLNEENGRSNGTAPKPGPKHRRNGKKP